MGASEILAGLLCNAFWCDPKLRYALKEYSLTGKVPSYCVMHYSTLGDLTLCDLLIWEGNGVEYTKFPYDIVVVDCQECIERFNAASQLKVT